MKTKFLSCAKLNLDLKILEKQSNGLHAISSSMQFIDLYDEITIELENNKTYELKIQGSIDCSSSSNLVTKAHKALQEVTNQNLPCKIYLKKNIPVQSGLGGGSSNAATTLLALNSLFKLKLSRKELVQIGHMLGSDVPFFIRSLQRGSPQRRVRVSSGWSRHQSTGPELRSGLTVWRARSPMTGRPRSCVRLHA